MKRWNFEQDEAGRSVIRHSAPPRFCAYWTSGAAQDAAPLEPYWTDAGSGADDALHLYGLQWIDAPPDAETAARLMRETAAVIDEWIVKQM